ncbi:MAG: MOSC domain-containing protein, partial [Chloroflexota bacterium]
ALAAGLDDPRAQRRFRLTLGAEGAPAWAEAGWVGRTLQGGAAAIRPGGDVVRCAVTTCDPDTGEPDADTLRWLRQIRGHRATGERLPFGVYARVVTPGMVRLGDPVVVTDAG